MVRYIDGKLKYGYMTLRVTLRVTLTMTLTIYSNDDALKLK